MISSSYTASRGVFGSDNYDEVAKVFEPFESAVSFGVPTRNCWDVTLVEGVLTHPWDGKIHSPFLLNPQRPSDSSQALLGCHLRDGILTHPRDGRICRGRKHNLSSTELYLTR